MKFCYTLLLGILLSAGTVFGQAQPRLIINEFLADPAGGDAGDANGDGVRHPQADEFVELVNISNEPIDLTGWRLGDDERVNFPFPAGYMLPARSFVVVFGFGDVSSVPGYDPDPLITRVFAAGDSIGNGLANGGDHIILLSADGSHDMYLTYGSQSGAPTSAAVEGVTFEYGIDLGMRADQDVSLTRSPDGNPDDATAWVMHTELSEALFSPGTTVGGQTEIPRLTADIPIIINEVLTNPPTGAFGDANGDGVREAQGDEFVELANVSDQSVDLSGWTIGDDESFVTFTFPQGYVLGPRELVVVFGGGEVSNVPGYDPDPLQTKAFVVDSLHLGGIGNGLANGGDILLLLSPDGSNDTYFAYGSLAHGNGPAEGKYPEGVEFKVEINVTTPGGANSFVRYPDGNITTADPFVQHLSVSERPFSPGLTIDGRDRLPPPKPAITVVINEILADTRAGDANRDGTVDAGDQFIEIVNISDEEAVDLSGWQVGNEGGLSFTFPQGYSIAPRKFIAVFGGGDVTGAPGYNANPLESRVFSAGGSLGNGFDPAGDYAVLVSADGSYDSFVAFGSKAGTGIPNVAGAGDIDWEFDVNTAAAADESSSITRDPDGNFLSPDPFVVHSSVAETAFSPAATQAGLGGLDDFVDVPHPWGTGHALHFKGFERDRVEVRNAAQEMPLRLDQGTVEFWFRPDSLLTFNTHDPDWTYLFSKNVSGNVIGDLGIGIPRGEGRINFFIQDGQNTTNVYSSERIDQVFHPRWYHLAATWNIEGSMRLYIDGKLVGEEVSNIPVYGGEQIIAIGGGAIDLFNSRYESFRGMMDDVRFSVVERYTSEFEPPTEPHTPDEFTLALWNFDEGSGNAANNVAVPGYLTGTLGGFDAEGTPDPLSVPQWVDVTTLLDTEGMGDLPGQFTLDQNYPNPFNPATTIHYTVPSAANVEISVFNVLGQRVQMLVNQQMSPGSYTVQFDGSRLASGMYFYVLRTGEVSLVKKMMLLK